MKFRAGIMCGANENVVANEQNLTEEEIMFLEAIQDKAKRREVISILVHAGSIPA